MASLRKEVYEMIENDKRVKNIRFEEIYNLIENNKSMQQELMSIAEVLQTVGGIALPPGPVRAAAQTEILLEDSRRAHRGSSMQLVRRMCTTWMAR